LLLQWLLRRTGNFSALRFPLAQSARRTKRIPVQLLEIGWIALAGGALIYLFDKPHPAGALALGALAWYGVGRFLLEPLREEPDIAFSARVNQVIAAIVSLIAGFWLLILLYDRR